MAEDNLLLDDEQLAVPKTADDLVKHISLLRQHIDLTLLLPYLLEQDALTSNDKHVLTLSSTDPKERINILITDILPTKGKSGLEFLIKGLKKSVDEPGSEGHRYVLESVFNIPTLKVSRKISMDCEDLNVLLIKFETTIVNAVDQNTIKVALQHVAFYLCNSKLKSDGGGAPLLSQDIKDKLLFNDTLTFLKLFNSLVKSDPPLILPNDVSLLHKINSVLDMETGFVSIMPTLKELVVDYEKEAAIENMVPSTESDRGHVIVRIPNASCGSPQLKMSVKDFFMKALDEIKFTFQGKDDGSVILFWEFQEQYFAEVQQSLKHACDNKITLGHFLITEVECKCDQNQLHVIMEIVDPFLLQFSQKKLCIAERISLCQESFLHLLLKIINVGGDVMEPFLVQSNATTLQLKEKSLLKVIEYFVSENKLHSCDISIIQHFIYDARKDVESTSAKVLEDLLSVTQDYEPACHEFEELPSVNVECAALVVTLFLGINCISFEVMMALKYTLSRFLGLSVSEFQYIKWEMKQDGLQVFWQTSLLLLGHIEAILQSSESIGGLILKELNQVCQSKIHFTCYLQDFQLLLDGAPLLIPDLKDKVCDVNSPYLSQVGHVCAACYVDYNWSYRLLWLQCCKPDEHVNAGKVAAVYYSADSENSSLWRVRPLPKVQSLLDSAMKRCVTKNCDKGRRCVGAHSNVEMIYWGFQEATDATPLQFYPLLYWDEIVHKSKFDDRVSKYKEKEMQEVYQHYMSDLSLAVSSDDGDQKLVEILLSLMHLKRDLCDRRLPPQTWINCFLLHKDFQQFFLYIKDKDCNSKLLPYLQNVIDVMDFSTEAIKSSNIKYFAQHLHKTANVDISFINLISIIQQACSDFITDVSAEVEKKSTIFIEQNVHLYFNYLQSIQQFYHMFFLCSLLLPLHYDVELNSFRFLLSSCNLDAFYEYAKKHTSNFFEIDERDVLKTQAYILYLAIEPFTNKDIKICDPASMCKEVQDYVKYLKKQFSEKDELHERIVEVMSVCHISKQEYDWALMYDYLAVLWKGENVLRNYLGVNMILRLNDYKKARHSFNDEDDGGVDATTSTNEFLDFFEKLGLLPKYPKMLCLSDALKICHDTLGQINNTENIHLLPYIVLQKILACDHRCRSCLLTGLLFSNDFDNDSDEDDDTDDDDDNDNDGGNDNDMRSVGIYPVDVILALLHCSDDFLRQELIRKLFACQIAVPLLLPDYSKNSITFLLWALRSIKKSWKSTCDGSKTFSKDVSIVEYSCPIVSFLRIGDIKKSKSQILNEVIGKEVIFFHRDCHGGNFNRCITNGVVELGCYFPNQSDSHFSDALVFTNLRGDAQNFLRQVDFIKSVSFMTFVLLSKRTLDNENAKLLLKNLTTVPGGIAIVLDDCKTFKTEKLISILQTKSFSKILLKGKNSATIQDEIRSCINERLKTSTCFSCISECNSLACQVGFEVDENDKDCLKGKELAVNVMNTFSGISLSEVRGKMLPLQGPTMWYTWAAHDKEFHRHYKRKQCQLSVEEYSHFITEEKSTIREIQLHSNLTPLVQVFLSNLLQYKGRIRNFFLHWQKILLEHYSRMELPKLQKEFRDTTVELSKLNSDSEKAKFSEKLKDLNLVIHAFFGLEHLFRELGQIYEAVIDTKHSSVPKELKEAISCLPQIAAEILIEGHALELMDGEVSHVPLTWLQAILKYLSKVFKNSRIVVFSIIGIQSTGKSTLLNAVFGVCFDVGAGRCTRGVFTQLIPLDDTLKDELQCDFLLIVDAEGLRASELQSDFSEHHDNELATFVVGIADFTIINIYGEAPADLSDILQTVIHALIRMKDVDKHPGCFFVHHNVTEQFANETTKLGRQIIYNRLNTLTEAAAKLEQCEVQFSKFSDVIQFNEETDIFFCSNLWKGDPPMAPVNLGYSQCTQDMKTALVNLIRTKFKNHGFSGIENRVSNIWKAILKEDFVFNFRNTLEVNAYSLFDAQYGKWSWSIQKVLVELQFENENKINSSKFEDLSEVESRCIECSKARLHAEKDKLIACMTEFIKGHDLSDILVKWQFNMKTKLSELCIECIEGIKIHCSVITQQRQHARKQEEMLASYEIQLRDEISVLIDGLNLQKIKNTEEIRRLFKSNWEQWLKKFSTNVSWIDYYTDKNIDESVFQSLEEQLNFSSSLLKVKVQERSLIDRENDILSHNMEIDVEKHIRQLKTSSADKPAHYQANNYLLDMEQKIENMEKTFKVFHRTLTDGLLRDLLQQIDNLNEDRKAGFIYTAEFKVEISLVVCSYAAKMFKMWTNNIKDSTNPTIALRNQESRFYSLFENKCTKVAAELAAANMLANSLTDAIANATVKVLPIRIVNHLRNDISYFNTKTGIKVQVLIDLAEKERFDFYQLYLSDTALFFKWWIPQFVKQHYEPSSKLSHFTGLINKEVETLMSQIKEAVNISENCDSTLWLDEFCCALNGKLEIKKGDWAMDVKGVNIDSDSMNSFKKNLIRNLEAKHKVISNLVLAKHNEICFNASNMLYTNVIQKTCTAQCPFCNEQCDLLNSEHPTQHKATLHRPQCVCKVTWYKTNKLVLDVCNSLVASDYYLTRMDRDENKVHEQVPYKEYHTLLDTWNIEEAKGLEAPVYWMWFTCQFYENLIDWCSSEQTDIPDIWKRITKLQATKSLKEAYNI